MVALSGTVQVVISAHVGWEGVASLVNEVPMIFYALYSTHCFICRPSDSTVSEDAGIEPRTVATSAWAVRHSNHSAGWYWLSGWYWMVLFGNCTVLWCHPNIEKEKLLLLLGEISCILDPDPN
jgi:hypothetical protein